MPELKYVSVPRNVCQASLEAAKYSETSIKRTLSRVPKLTSYISLYNEPLFSGHLY